MLSTIILPTTLRVNKILVILNLIKSKLFYDKSKEKDDIRSLLIN